LRKKVDICDIKRLLRADFFAKDRDVTLQNDRYFFLGDGTQIDSESNLLPDGNIVLMFSGAVVDIPTGWQLADGTNGTTDLRNMFVVGAGDTYNPGDTGGADTVDISHTHGPGTLNTDSDTHNHDVQGTSGSESSHTHGAGSYAADTYTPAYCHDITASGANTAFPCMDHSHDVTGTSGSGSSHSHSSGSYATDNDTHDHNVDSGVTASGGDTTHDNRPSFYALCLIMRPTA
jgi:hypothetical protein